MLLTFANRKVKHVVQVVYALFSIPT